jgi:hypothetical protein
MTFIPLDITNCSVVELLLQVFALVYGSYGERHCITSPNFFEHRKQYNSTAIIVEDNQANASAQPQVNDFISVCGKNDTQVRDYANPVELPWDFNVCQGAPCHLLQLAEKISSVFLWATLHRVGFTHCTKRDQGQRDA